MKKIFFSHFFSVFISLMFLVPIISFAAIDSDKNSTTKKEDNSRYVYLGNELSNIVQVVKQISALDEDQDSILHAMKKYIDNGYFVAGYDEVMDALTYAQELIERSSTNRSNTKTNKKWLRVQISELIKQLTDGSLSVNSETLEHMPEQQEMATRAHAFVINKNLRVHGQSWFDEHIRTYQGIHVSGHLKVSKNSKFKKNLRVKGTLSASDAIIGTLSVTDLVVLSCVDNLCVENLSTVDATIDNLTVTDLTVLSCVDNLCVNNLSVTDLAVVSCIDNLCVNNLSVGDLVIASCIDAICVTDLSIVDLTITGTASINDAVINNLTVTDLTVLSCIDNLCVDTLSVTDLTVISCIDDLCVDTLSATDIFASSLSLCDIIVACDIFMNNSTGSAVGNIMKAGNRFIHNFGTFNTFVGVNAGNFTMTGVFNTAVGTNALTTNTLGSFNTAFGVNALVANTTGNTNTAIGHATLTSNTTGINNTAVGNSAMGNNTIGTSNVAVGADALLANATGNFNVAVGVVALSSNTTGIQNTAVGNSALQSSTIAIQNVAVGANALINNITGNNNVALGRNALANANSNSNIGIGSSTGISLTTGTGNIYIDADASIATESNTTRIGTSKTSCFIAGIRGATTGIADAIAVLIDSAGQLGTISSSQNVKHDIEDMGDASNSILDLRPVTFVYNGDESNKRQYGLIAEEADEIFPDIVVKNEQGQPATIQYHVLPVLLLNEIKKQYIINNRQDEELKNLTITIETMKVAIDTLKLQLQNFIDTTNLEQAA